MADSENEVEVTFMTADEIVEAMYEQRTESWNDSFINPANYEKELARLRELGI